VVRRGTDSRRPECSGRWGCYPGGMPGLPLRTRRQRAAGFTARHIASIGRRLALRPATGTPATAASRTIGTSNAAVTYSLPTWRGASGNTWRVAHVIPGGAGAALSVVVSERDVTINGATAAAGVSSSTAAQVAAAVNAQTALTDQGFTATAGGTGASPIVAGAIANLTGGVGA
jgi:hypothetical protein